MMSWIDAGLTCNNYKDCPGGDDECQDCQGDGGSVSSSERMIRSLPIQAWISIECLLVFLLNSVAVWDVWMREASSESAKVDKLILLSVCFYDSLMGFYLAFIFAKSIKFSSEYCQADFEWRSSLGCTLQGCLFTFSSHGSLFMVSFTSLTRYCKCVLQRNISFKLALIIAICLHLVNAAHSVLPVLPISAIQDIFRERMTFTDNPFIQEFSLSKLVARYKLYFGLADNSTVPSTYTMLDHLKNVSTTGGMFSTRELGYYSYSSLCIQNMYGHQESLLEYKIGYMACLILLIAVVSTSYISIVCHAFRTARNANQMAALAINNSNNDLSVKVMLMIGSQLVCWITVMILTLVYSSLTNLHAPQLLYELTAVVILPLNSYLNPIFNSLMYKMVLEKAKGVKERLTKIGEAVLGGVTRGEGMRGEVTGGEGMRGEGPRDEEFEMRVVSGAI